jgi:hypothetical protein
MTFGGSPLSDRHLAGVVGCRVLLEQRVHGGVRGLAVRLLGK